jgi:hypothetical protein
MPIKVYQYTQTPAHIAQKIAEQIEDRCFAIGANDIIKFNSNIEIEFEERIQEVLKKFCVENASSSKSLLPNDIQEAVAKGDVSEQLPMLSNVSFSNLITNDNLSQQNTVSNQQAMNQLALTVIAATVNRISDSDPMEAVAINMLNNDNDLAAQLAEFKVTAM